MYKIKQAADLAGMTVRMLHHYDQIGLLSPEQTTEAGYRLYSDRDLAVLWQIKLYREFDFKLAEIRQMLDSSETMRLNTLIQQRELLDLQIVRLENIRKQLDHLILEKGTIKVKRKDFKAFDMSAIEKHKEEHREEVKMRWGTSVAYQESSEKTANYQSADWQRIQEDQNRIYAAFAELRNRSVDDPEVQQLVKEWQAHITHNFYQCTNEILAGLGQMYVADERFTKNINKHGAGLAEFISEAIKYYCAKL